MIVDYYLLGIVYLVSLVASWRLSKRIIDDSLNRGYEITRGGGLGIFITAMIPGINTLLAFFLFYILFSPKLDEPFKPWWRP